MKDVKKSFKDRKFKMGGYQTLVMVIVIVLVVVLNLIVNKMSFGHQQQFFRCFVSRILECVAK